MNKERRTDQRVPTNLSVKWEGLSGGHEARIEDISLGGCFVNTTVRVDIGEVVVLQVKLPAGEWLTLRGETTSYQEGLGFGLVFRFTTAEEENALRDLIHSGRAY